MKKIKDFTHLFQIIFLVFAVLLSSFLILILWEQTILLIILLVIIAYIKHFFYPIKKELLWFLMVSLSGLLIEIFSVNFGGIWSYITGHVVYILNVPIFMPIYWGVVGTTAISLYKNLFND